MQAAALAEYVREKLGDKVVAADVAYEQVTVTVAPDALPTAARLCKEDHALACDFFDFLCGVDERDQGFAVVTRLYSVTHRHGVTLRTLAEGGREQPRVPTLTGVYRGANWHEREAYDMFGIVFDGHPELLPRILTVENFEGWPLRKEFPLASREVKPWPGAKEPGGGAEGEHAAPVAALEPGAPPVDKAAAAKEKAERAKALAAEARARKAAERAEELTAAEPTAADEVPIEEAAEAIAAAPTAAEAATVAAELADTDIAMDAAAGTVTGDTAAGATSDEPGTDEPRPDPAHEAAAHEGGPAEHGGTPGVEAEGSRDEAADEVGQPEPEQQAGAAGVESVHAAEEPSQDDRPEQEDPP